jgi:hypothetical protein
LEKNTPSPGLPSNDAPPRYKDAGMTTGTL